MLLGKPETHKEKSRIIIYQRGHFEVPRVDDQLPNRMSPTLLEPMVKQVPRIWIHGDHMDRKKCTGVQQRLMLPNLRLTEATSQLRNNRDLTWPLGLLLRKLQ